MSEYVDSLSQQPLLENWLEEGEEEKEKEEGKFQDHRYTLPEEDDLEDLTTQIPHLMGEDVLSLEISDHTLHPIIQYYHERMQYKMKLDELFKFDEGDRNHSIEKFYKLLLNKLTAFSFAVLTLDTGMVPRAPSWKDQLGENLFSFISSASQTTGIAGAFAFGAGAIIPAAVLPLLASTNSAWQSYREHKKQIEHHHAAQQYDDGIEGIERKNRLIAYQLASLLKMQLRYCTPEGVEAIADDWLYRLFHQLMKNHSEGLDEEKAGELEPLLSFIKKGKEKKNPIQTNAQERNWNTLGLFERSGIVYYENSEICYESCFVENKKQKASTPFSRAEKYGYFFFPSKEEAENYKLARNEDYNAWQRRLKLTDETFVWKRDSSPQGPKIYLEDASHISSPTLFPSSFKKSEKESDGSHSAVHSQSLPVLSTVLHRLDDLDKENKMLVKQLHDQAERLKNIEDRLAQINNL